MRILVTGGAGAIGSAVIRMLIGETDHEVLNVDCLTYASNLDSLAGVSQNIRYRFSRTDIRSRLGPAPRRRVQTRHRDAPGGETHVDRSIDGPAAFIETNLVGTANLLEVARAHWQGLDGAAKARFRFHHISTDEVFGSLGPTGAFTEESPYAPNSPYSASKAGADHLVRAWRETFGLPTVASNCSNNYGPCQFPEKLIPLMVLNALEGKPLPVYGDGMNVRDWLHVEDHARALIAIATRGVVGESYNGVGGNAERTNIDIVRADLPPARRAAPRSHSICLPWH